MKKNIAIKLGDNNIVTFEELYINGVVYYVYEPSKYILNPKIKLDRLPLRNLDGVKGYDLSAMKNQKVLYYDKIVGNYVLCRDKVISLNDFSISTPLGFLIGKTATKVEHTDETFTIYLDNNIVVELNHIQDCCEYVHIESIDGDINDLVGHPFTLSDESVRDSDDSDNSDNSDESCTWTFYRFATVKGYVNVRWIGTSNGYYSESVDQCIFFNNSN